MYYLILSFTIVVLISATPLEEICDKCVPKERCQIFGSLNRDDQNKWIETFSCNEPKQNDYGTPRGFGATANGDYICCSDKIWGIDNTSKQGQFNPNSQNNLTKDKYLNANYENGSPGNYYAGNYYTNGPNDDINTNNQGNDNFYSNIPKYNSTPDNNQQTNDGNNINKNKWPPNKIYWNQRPDEKRWWNSRNQYLDNDKNNYNNDPRYGNNNRNYYNSNQRPGFTTRPRPPNDNNQGTQNNNNNGYPHATPNPYFRNDNSQGNSFRKFGQCDRVTSFPPDPQSGCCGREASDDDRITDTPNAPIDDTAPAAYPNYPSNWAPLQEGTYNSDLDWPLWAWKDEEQRPKRDLDDQNKTVEVQIENRISGGTETELYQFPWTVLLVTTFDYGNKQTAFSCGGSLISSNYVLSAGHCVYDEGAVVKNIEVYLAEYDKRTFPRDCKTSPGRGRQCVDNIVMYAERVIRHPQYDDQTLRNDISLIKLKGNAPYTDFIRPICLTSINIDEPDFSNLRLSVAGWGRNGQYRTNVKQSTFVNLVPQNECKRYYPDLTTRHLCAAGYTGEDTCKGDSGGPLMTLYRGTYYVVGVVSGKRADSPCGTSVPSLYTNVYHYIDWIRNNVRN